MIAPSHFVVIFDWISTLVKSAMKVVPCLLTPAATVLLLSVVTTLLIWVKSVMMARMEMILMAVEMTVLFLFVVTTGMCRN